MAFDRDEDALSQAPDDPRFLLIHNNFRFIHNYTLLHAPGGLDGILADLGVSSHQFDTAERGFSFRFPQAPLDMRMNVQGGKTAADIVNSYTQEELEKIFRLYGELDNAHRVSRLIAEARSAAPILTTDDLDHAIAAALPSFAEHKYLAKVYQALRIEVNEEMRALEKFLSGAAASLKPGGRLAVITYHSLEDRMVKNFIRSGNIGGLEEKDMYGRSSAPLKAVDRKPVVPDEAEIAANTRARSAKLRIAQKV
jgi:16S rRNA (cytosine1402-N4)-methyltransferase